MSDEFSVVEWFEDGTYAYTARWLSAEIALRLAKRMIEDRTISPAKRITVTDGGDDTVFDWREGEGIVWPAHDGSKFIADGKQPPPWP